MPEAEAVFLGEDRRCGLDELLAREHHQVRAGCLSFLDRCQCGECAAPEFLADHGRAFDEGPLLGLEPVETGREQRVDRRRDRESARRRAGLGQHRQHLLDEERVPLRGLGDADEKVGGELRVSAQKLEQGLRFGFGQGIEVDP